MRLLAAGKAIAPLFYSLFPPLSLVLYLPAGASPSPALGVQSRDCSSSLQSIILISSLFSERISREENNSQVSVGAPLEQDWALLVHLSGVPFQHPTAPPVVMK